MLHFIFRFFLKFRFTVIYLFVFLQLYLIFLKTCFILFTVIFYFSFFFLLLLRLVHTTVQRAVVNAYCHALLKRIAFFFFSKFFLYYYRCTSWDVFLCVALCKKGRHFYATHTMQWYEGNREHGKQLFFQCPCIVKSSSMHLIKGAHELLCNSKHWHMFLCCK